MESKDNIALEFNEFSKNYTHDMIACAPNYLDLIKSFGKYFPDGFKPDLILDLGCGNGNITAQLLTYFPDATFVLVDASLEMINLCRHRFKDYKFIYHNTYFQDFHFEKEKYGLVAAGFSLHHLEDIEKQSIFEKINFTLKPGGIFSYSDLMIDKTSPDHSMLLEKWNQFVNISFPDGEKWKWIMEHYEAFDKPTDYSKQIEWIKTAGFTDIQMPFKKDYWIYLQAIKENI